MRGRLASGDEWWRPLPPGASADALRVLAARGMRAFGDGYVALAASDLSGRARVQRARDRGHRHQDADRHRGADALGRVDR